MVRKRARLRPNIAGDNMSKRIVVCCDDIFLFAFIRGADTARSLKGAKRPAGTGPAGRLLFVAQERRGLSAQHAPGAKQAHEERHPHPCQHGQ